MIDIWSYFGGRGAPPLPKGEPGASRGMRKAKAGFNSFPGAQPGEGAFAPPFAPVAMPVADRDWSSWNNEPEGVGQPAPVEKDWSTWNNEPDGVGQPAVVVAPGPRSKGGREDGVPVQMAPRPQKPQQPMRRDPEFQARLEAAGFGPNYEYAMVSPFGKDPKG